jgi:uncharacterized membrane protein YraQ (UPF0718 family)
MSPEFCAEFQERGVRAGYFAAQLLLRLVPVLGLVFILVFVSNLFLNPQFIRTHMGRDAGLRGWLMTMVCGILSVGHVYTWYALLGDLKTKGMRPAFIAAFLYNRVVKIPLLPLMIHYFGWSYTVVLSVYLTIFAVVNGVTTEWLSGTGEKGSG